MKNPYFRPHLTYFSKLSIYLSFHDQIKWLFLQKNHSWWGYHLKKEFGPFGWWEKEEWLKKWVVEKLAGVESREVLISE